MAHQENVEALIREIRVASERLEAAADELEADLGVTTAMRGVLETLSAGRVVPVPQIAREHSVSRQHIQLLVNRLRARRLCVLRTNPAHARSPLVELTPKGAAVVETLRECEESLARELGGMLTLDVPAALAVLKRLNAALARRISG